MTFEQYCKEQGFILTSWQIEASRAILSNEHVIMNRSVASGRTFLFEQLLKFISIYGNSYEAVKP